MAAEEAAGIQMFKLLSRSRHRLKGVFSSGNSKTGSNVAQTAGNMGYAVFDAKLQKKPEIAEWVRHQEIDILINVNTHYAIHPDILNVLKIGAFNLHPGPLPEYAGLNIPNWAIYNKEKMHAVTLHWIEPGIDTGDIVFQYSFPIKQTDTGLSLSARCIFYGLPLIQKLLEIAENDPTEIPARPQDLLNRKFYRSTEIPGNGFLNWKQPAENIDAFVRACDYFPFTSTWGYPKTSDGYREISIAKTSVSPNLCIAEPGTVCFFEKGPAVATSKSWLIIDRCYSSGEYIPPEMLLRNGQRLGFYR